MEYDPINSRHKVIIKIIKSLNLLLSYVPATFNNAQWEVALCISNLIGLNPRMLYLLR